RLPPPPHPTTPSPEKRLPLAAVPNPVQPREVARGEYRLPGAEMVVVDCKGFSVEGGLVIERFINARRLHGEGDRRRTLRHDRSGGNEPRRLIEGPLPKTEIAGPHQ